jgi:hypothetical protein
VRPILAKLQAYLQEQQAAALPKSPLGATIGCWLCNWVALTRYAEATIEAVECCVATAAPDSLIASKSRDSLEIR